jgi:1-pyrroline-5-carboxylate dehydrogenase
MAEEVKKKLIAGVKSFKMGTVEDFTNFINAVIDEKVSTTSNAILTRQKKTPRLKYGWW